MGGGGSFTASPSGYQVSVSSGGQVVASDRTVTLEPVPASGATGGCFSIPLGRYRGRLVLVARGGGIDVVNEVMVDDWLKGVVGAEIGDEAPIEALKAQAVCARSEAIHKLTHPPHAGEGFDFCTGVHCQAYKGMREESPATCVACEQTLGVVLTAGADRDVMDGVYSNVCGGVTALPEDVWSGGPQAGFIARFDSPTDRRAPDLSGDAAMAAFLREPAQDTLCDPAGKPEYASYARKYYRWTKSLNAGQLAARAGVGRVRDIRVVERRPSGRVWRLAVEGDRGTKTFEKELPIRNAFDLWSGVFLLTVQRTADGAVAEATFSGAGNGHGVGLCQHGARSAAARGATYDRILGHYYPGARLERIYRP